MVVLGLDPRPLAAGAATANASMMKLSTGAAKGLGAIPIGAAAAGLAIGAFAAKSVAAAVSFDKAFTRIDAISNASAESIQVWKSQVMDLAGETKRAPAELADALFFLSSAGLEAGQVMETLEMSAKASAAGLGSTTDVAKITANALNAYSKAGLTAAQVTDTLVAAVREGSAEPEEFASALGRILPVASQAGIEFDEVTASLAALSNIGLDVNEGVTAMRGLMTALLAPTAQTQDAMKKLGLSTDEVRSSLAEDGLIATLRMLEEATGGNIDQMKALVTNVRALTGVFGLTTQEASKVDEIFNQVKNSTGSLAEAFRTTAESDSFKLEKAWNDLQIAGQSLAMRVLPTLAGSLQLVADHLQTVVEAAIAFKVARLMGAGIGPSLGLAAAVGLVAFGFETMARDAEQNRQVLEGWISALLDGTMTVTSLLNEIESLKAETEGFGVAGEALRHELDAMGTTAVFLTTALGPLDGAFSEIGGAIQGLEGPLEHLATQIDETAQKVKNFAGMTDKEFKDFRSNAIDSIQGVVGSLTGFQRRWELTSREAARAMENMVKKSREMRNAYDELDRIDVLPRFREFLITQGPDAVVAFTGLSKKEQQKFEAQWSQTDRNVQAAIGDLPAKLKADGRASGQSFGLGLIGGIQQMTPGVTAAARAMAQGAVDAVNAVLENQSPSKVMHEAGVNFMLGFTNGIRDQMGELVSTIQQVVGEGLSKARLLQAKELQAMASEVADRLERLQSQIEGFRDAIRSGFEDFDLISGGMGLADVLKQQQLVVLQATLEAARAVELPDQVLIDSLNAQIEALRDALIVPTAEQFGEFLLDQLQTAQQFARGLKQLQALGLDKTLLADLASQGPEALPFIQALLSGGQAVIDQFNETQSAINEIAGNVTGRLIDEVFGARIERAGEAVAALADEISAFLEAIRPAAVEAEVDDVVRALRRLAAMLDNLPNVGGGGGNGGNNGSSWGGSGSFGGMYAPALAPMGGGTTVVVNIEGDVLTEGQLIDKIHEGLLRKKRNNVDLGLG